MVQLKPYCVIYNDLIYSIPLYKHNCKRVNVSSFLAHLVQSKQVKGQYTICLQTRLNACTFRAIATVILLLNTFL